jgi:hypothetical protein
MMYGVKISPGRLRQHLSVSKTNGNAANQTRPAGCRNGADVRQFNAGQPQRFRRYGVHGVDMRTRRNFRHHAAIGLMFRQLRTDDVG